MTSSPLAPPAPPVDLAAPVDPASPVDLATPVDLAAPVDPAAPVGLAPPAEPTVALPAGAVRALVLATLGFGVSSWAWALLSPLGPVLVISAFNFPVAVWAWNAALALVCGDPVVWKPSEKTPITAAAVMALAERALKRFGDTPDGLLQVAQGGRELGEALVDDPRMALVSATGSTATTSAPRAASGTVSLPVPAPTSTTRSPAIRPSDPQSQSTPGPG